ncbi:hypothetical protein [Curtobacterium sp. MCBD17_040]|uniref:RCC1 domain-containing protein n=1 Tax=Curtobacterium sp. MCBD17_040 TaxID=2175674 RepID=UPI000DA7D3B7|nr:hypothetical protein [Curtobacterium sp. MCBD17_040]WIB65650.1 hypothetical protein DEI94_16145 [Curtobacterium sp. MCBD17_040]
MLRRIVSTIRSDRGFIDVFIIGIAGVMMLLGMGFAVVNFAYEAGAVKATKDLTSAVVGRAQEYAAALNSNLSAPPVPSQAQECSAAPSVCTIVTADTSTGADARNLTIIASAPYHSMTLTRTVTLQATEATHVSDIDAAGNPTWVDTNETNPYRIWGVAQSSIKAVPAASQAGPDSVNSWNSVTARAGVDANGALWVWGPNDQCQAGTGDSSTLAAPVKLDSGATTFVTVVGDGDNEFALDSLGDVYAWGANTDGSLGLGITSPVCSPTLIAGHHFLQISSDEGSTFGIDINHALWAWGSDANSRLGDGSTSNQNAPEQIATGTKFDAVATSGASTYAVSTSLALWSWGANTDGQLGTGTTTPVASAAAAGISGTFTHIAAGANAGYAIDTAGHLWTWGLNTSGQLGDGSTTNRTAPVRVTSNETYTDVTGGNGRAFAVNANGQLEAWGDGTGGALGIGSAGSEHTPTVILPDSDFNDVIGSADSNATVTRDSDHALWAIGPTPGNHGVWPSTSTTTTGVPLRMPAPDGFGTPAWN